MSKLYPNPISIKNLVLDLKAKYPGQVKFCVASNLWERRYIHYYPTLSIMSNIEPGDLGRIEGTMGCGPKGSFIVEHNVLVDTEGTRAKIQFTLDIPSWKRELLPGWFDNSLIWNGNGYTVSGCEALRKYCEDCYAEERRALGLE